ncbi:MAG: multidrug efflux MFS transporter [Chloroflexi bacterium]|nr:MDR family MFS transporter [Anaerolineaceae bacterium]NMB89698.1 multidrug efflux MFS transporter [Chloroflexota bacterium]
MQDQIPPAGPQGSGISGYFKHSIFSQYKWRVLATVIFGIFMIILDTTVVNVAFQTIREEFRGGLNDSQWVISIYVLALGISTPMAGFLADRFGTKRIYLGGLGLFALGSLLCGLAPSLPLLITARAIQGVAGGLTMPLGTALLLQAFPPREQGTALGIFGIAALVAPAVGPILGGWLVDQNLWRAIFFINPPIGLIGVILGIFLLREHTNPEKPAFDIGGVVTEIVGFGSILYAASIAADQGWTSPQTLFWFGLGGVGLLLFGWIELRHAKTPLLDLNLFRNRVFLNASVLGYVSTVALFGAEFLMPVYLQALRGLSALQTGLILLPMALTGGIFVTLSGRLYDRFGPRPLMVVGFTFLVVNTWQLALIQGDTPVSWILFLLALRGVALGLTVQTTLVTALSVVPWDDLARGSSLSNATRFVIQSIGVAVLATVLASTLSPEVKTLQSQIEVREPGMAQPAGICEIAAAPAAVSAVSLHSGGLAYAGAGPLLAARPQGIIEQACEENIAGFERAYKITFYAAILALLLGSLLPGWPGKWVGRGGG